MYRCKCSRYLWISSRWGLPPQNFFRRLRSRLVSLGISPAPVVAKKHFRGKSSIYIWNLPILNPGPGLQGPMKDLLVGPAGMRKRMFERVAHHFCCWHLRMVIWFHYTRGLFFFPFLLLGGGSFHIISAGNDWEKLLSKSEQSRVLVRFARKFIVITCDWCALCRGGVAFQGMTGYLAITICPRSLLNKYHLSLQMSRLKTFFADGEWITVLTQ